ncbi:J domain-containing protein [Luteibacter aegosomatissinici]|uniref:J domain-containing protein n=1 Tax=Luteibacter aegosomatissinici TaxID=2911539 RepID=UPI001FFA8976|nr:J domain-containing protein [Luteibacter aegosomatissinici]UPG96436.1 J domain-containing protein [Luteibacter aegosomatissinici]
MADETDFLDLYGKLRLQPDCSLAEFKQAYRRHVSQWHPDRRTRGVRADALAARRLQRLMAQYSAAMEFHKRHGRLPGAVAVKVAPEVPSNIVVFVPRERPVGEPEVTEEPGAVGIARKRARTKGIVWLAVISVVGVAAWMFIPDPDRVDPSVEGIPVVAAEAEAPAIEAGVISLGMKDNEVVALEGEPTLRSADRWEYGPSWVRFEGGSVVDWYSSPLRTLHVQSSHAPR